MSEPSNEGSKPIKRRALIFLSADAALMLEELISQAETHLANKSVHCNVRQGLTLKEVHVLSKEFEDQLWAQFEQGWNFGRDE